MSSSVHPFQPNPGDSQYGAPGGFVHYGNAGNMGVAALGGANGANGQPNGAAPSSGAPGAQGYAYAAPGNYGYPVGGAPGGGTQAYFAAQLQPGVQGGYLSGLPGAQTAMYGAPNATGYPDSAPGGHQGAPRSTQGGAPVNGNNAQAYATGHPANVQGSSPPGFQASPQDMQHGAPAYSNGGAPAYYQPPGYQTNPQNAQITSGNTAGASMHTPGYQHPTNTPGAYTVDNAQGYALPGSSAGGGSAAPGASTSAPGSAQGMQRGGVPPVAPGAAMEGVNGSGANSIPGANIGAPYGTTPGVQGMTPGNNMNGTPGYGYGANATVYPTPYAVPPGSAPMNFNGDKGQQFQQQQQQQQQQLQQQQQQQQYYQQQQYQQQHYQQQQQPQQPHQQAPVNPRNQIETGRWAAGLCSCFDHFVPNCMMATCFPCVSLAQIYARLGLMGYLPALFVFFCLTVASYCNVLSPLATTTSYMTVNYGSYYYGYQSYQIPVEEVDGGAMAALMALTIGSQVLNRCLTWRARSVIRSRFSIPGSPVEDCCAVCCCSCCVVAQMATHVKSYTPGSCGFGSPDVLQGYRSS